MGKASVANYGGPYEYCKRNHNTRLRNQATIEGKILKLSRILKISHADTIYVLMKLWTWVAENRPSGELTDFDEEYLNIICDWANEISLFQTLIELRFIDVVNKKIVIHDWTEHQPWVSASESRTDSSRYSRMCKLFPLQAEVLRNLGINSISKKDYEAYKNLPPEALKKILTNSNESPTNRSTNSNESPTNRSTNSNESPTNRSTNSNESPTNRSTNSNESPTNRSTNSNEILTLNSAVECVASKGNQAVGQNIKGCFSNEPLTNRSTNRQRAVNESSTPAPAPAPDLYKTPLTPLSTKDLESKSDEFIKNLYDRLIKEYPENANVTRLFHEQQVSLNKYAGMGTERALNIAFILNLQSNIKLTEHIPLNDQKEVINKIFSTNAPQLVKMKLPRITSFADFAKHFIELTSALFLSKDSTENIDYSEDLLRSEIDIKDFLEGEAND